MSAHGIMVAAAVVTAGAAALGGYLVRGSTAVPAAVWAFVAAIALALESLAAEFGWLVEPGSRGAARLVVVALSVCPAMSILGAKRPQHGVWQFIVATLAGVLSMPAATAVLVRPGSMPDVSVIERWFLPLLVLVGWLNYVATRRMVAVSLVASGQIMLMWAMSPIVGEGEPLSAEREALAAVAVAAGAVLAAVQVAVWPVTSRMEDAFAAGINPPWLALRETLGAAWTLRIAERFNGVAAERGWPFRLRFGGLVMESQDVMDSRSICPRQAADATRCLRSLLRRFVSTAWLKRHGDV